jgi:hypothetical protein
MQRFIDHTMYTVHISYTSLGTYFCNVSYTTMHTTYVVQTPEAEFLDEIQTKVLRVSLLVIHSHLYSFVMRFLFLQIHPTSYSFCKGERRKTWFKKLIQKPQGWELSRLCPETVMKLYVHKFGFCSYTSILILNTLVVNTLKGQCHEIFDFWFFSWISFPQAPEYTIRAVSNFFENSRRYSQLKVCHRCRWHRWQVQKIFNHKSINYLVWTPWEVE